MLVVLTIMSVKLIKIVKAVRQPKLVNIVISSVTKPSMPVVDNIMIAAIV
jgi:hypothetical protein